MTGQQNKHGQIGRPKYFAQISGAGNTRIPNAQRHRYGRYRSYGTDFLLEQKGDDTHGAGQQKERNFFGYNTADC